MCNVIVTSQLPNAEVSRVCNKQSYFHGSSSNNLICLIIPRETKIYKFQLVRLPVRLAVPLYNLVPRLYLRKYTMKSFWNLHIERTHIEGVQPRFLVRIDKEN